MTRCDSTEKPKKADLCARIPAIDFRARLRGISCEARIHSRFMSRLFVQIVVLMLVPACLCLVAFAESNPLPLKVNSTTSTYDLRGHLAIYEDKAGAETIDAVRSKMFRTTEEAAPNLGFTRSVGWIKLPLENETSEPVTLILEIANHYLDFIDVFVTSNQSPPFELYRGGARVPFSERVSESRYPVLNLHFEPQEQKTIFIRVQSRTPLRVPLILSSEQAHGRSELEGYLFMGFFYGSLVFLIIYNLLAWTILKQRVYLYYILTITGVCAWQLALDGLVPRVTIFSQPERMLHLLHIGTGLTFVFNIIFVSRFMDARATYPILYRVLDFFLVLAVINLILYVVDFYLGNILGMIYGPILACAFVVVIGLMWYGGRSRARYLFLAHVQFPIIAVVTVGSMVGFIPFHFVLVQLLKVAYLWQGLFFSLALVDRYSIMQRNFRHSLEARVAERSAELMKANESLQSEIIERKSVERAVVRAKREWEQTFDTVPDLIAIVDENHAVLRINKAMADKMNLHPREAIGKNCYELCHGTTDPIPGCPLQESVADGREHSAEIFESRLGGTYLISVSPLKMNGQQAPTFVHVARDITERKIFEEELRKLAVTDGLTNIWNRRHFIHLCERELDRTKRYGGQLALLMIDLDHFKDINDAYGHDVGDETLKKVAEIGRTTLRQVDIFARFGGEEFIIALPESSEEQALHVAERLRQTVAATPIKSYDPPLHITLSLGVTVSRSDRADLPTLLKQADIALYRAKSKGRNRVEVFEDHATAHLV